jgi:hypothetical protein
MNYGYTTCGGVECDFNYLRHPGWDESTECIKKYFSRETVDLISRQVTKLTMGVDPKNRPIIVPRERICEVMDGVYQSYTPPVGDIHTRYIITSPENKNMVQSMIDQTIEVITEYIRTELGMEQANAKLSAWVQVYGDFNTSGLRQHAPIKVRDKKPSTMQFNMNY